MGIEKLTLNDIDKPKRPTLGDSTPVVVFRLLRLLGMHKILGDSAGHTLYMAGKELGATLPVSSVEEFLKLVRDMKIGLPEIVDESEDRLVIFLKECITCSGLPDIGQMVCNFEGGIIAGAVEKITGRPARAVQTKSSAAGFDGCEFEVALF